MHLNRDLRKIKSWQAAGSEPSDSYLLNFRRGNSQRQMLQIVIVIVSNLFFIVSFFNNQILAAF